LAALAFALYRPSLRNPLLWDDELQVPAMRDAPLAAAFSRAPGQYRRPLVLLSYALQARAGLDSPAAFHAVNVGLHALNGVLLFLLCLRFGIAPLTALAASAVFVAHPLSSAAVAYVSGRTDLLAALFTLAALHAALSAMGGLGGDEKDLASHAALGNGSASALRSLLAIATALLVACAGLSKESGLLAAVLVLLLARMAAPGAARMLTVAVSLAAAAVVAVFVWPPALAGAFEVAHMDRLRAIGTSLRTYGRLAVHPTDLHLDRISEILRNDLVVGAGGAAALAGIVLLFLRRPSRLHFVVAALAVTLLPASNALPVYPSIVRSWVFTGEQLAYMPLAPLVVLAFALLARLVAAVAGPLPIEGVTVLAAAAAALALSARPIAARQLELSDAFAVYRNTLVHSPSPRACFNLGVGLLGAGKADEAIAVYERCARISPNDAKVHVQLGTAYQRSGDRNKAELSYARALELDARDPYAWSNYASLEASSGFYEQARAKWQKALEISPGFAPALDGLAKLDTLKRRQPSPRPPS
jgi:tetratricopeptide (TPR) repeat protein